MAISLTEEDEGFLLSVKNGGKTKTVKLSPSEVIDLAHSATSMRWRAQTKQNPEGLRAVAAVPVSRFHLAPDAMRQVALLTMFDRSDISVTHAFPPPLLSKLANELLHLIDYLGKDQPIQ